MLLSPNPFELFARLEEELKDLTHAPLYRTQGLTFKPSAEVSLEGEDALVTFDLPGVDVDNDLEITLDGGLLQIRGERQGSTQSADNRNSEIWRGSFKREFTVPTHLKAEDIEASYDRGQLQLRLKNAAPKKADPIKIDVAKGSSNAKSIES